MRSEHALQFHEQALDRLDLREVLGAIPERAMVLLGAPGCGKSTLLRRLQLDDARERLADGGDTVSLFVSLGAYPLDKKAPEKNAPRPLDWLQAQWHRLAPDLPDLEALLKERRVLLLLDALNEMPHGSVDDFRDRVEKWRCFLRDDFPPGNRAVFSCRSLDYSEELSIKDDLQVRQVLVKPLTSEQIEEFLRLHSPEHAAGAWGEIRGNERLLELYSTPYFLKLLVDQLAYDPRVANERAALFTGFVRRALEREIAGRNPLFVQDGVIDDSDREQIAQRDWQHAYDLPVSGPLVSQLGLLAYRMQEQFGRSSDGKQVMMPRKQLLDLFEHPQANDLLKAGKALALLDEEHRIARFCHQLLQEYFAARQLAKQPADVARLAHTEWRADRVKPSLADKVATLLDFEPLPPLTPTGWEETAVLAVGMAAEPDGFARGLAEVNLVLAARCAAAVRTTGRAKPDTVEMLKARLVTRSRDPDADLRARISAARVLGELGDPRFERHTGPHGDYLLPPLVPVEADTYRIGSDEGLYANEAPAHPVPIATDFSIGQFPVTNAEWQLFMDAGGYQDERWWDTVASKRWRRGEDTAEGPKQQQRDFRRDVRAKREQIGSLLKAGKITSTDAQSWTLWYLEMSGAEFDALLDQSFASGVQRRPRYWDDPTYSHRSQPLVGICWHEARAYCAWLSAQAEQCYRLPSEAEWEAAAGGLEGRRYSWGKDFDAARCNTSETHVRGTTPVGVFPGGDTHDRAADLNGSVWEWTGSLLRPYPYVAADGRENPENPENADGRRVVRGGSWRNDRDVARCACRDSFDPDFRFNFLGFRVVCVSPIR
ncbi:MAG: SUMF1/EgtB/PvdO family nonheme iron enzyme [Rhodocyclaceae bacterium]|nr:SUMF1/EgtB/PvdO family nonheme iron enzyme [Rhodocyclaceae bacterium]